MSNNHNKPGSSAQAKLLAELERDRSNQFDRMHDASQDGGQSFRSPGPNFGGAAAENSFNHFQGAQGGLPGNLAPSPNPGLAMSSSIPSSPVQWTINRRTGQPIPVSEVNNQGEHWTDEFVRLSLGHGQPAARDDNGAPLVPYPNLNFMARGPTGGPTQLTQYYYAPPRTQPQSYLPDPRGANLPPVGVVRGPPLQPMQQMQQQMGQMPQMPATSAMMAAQMQYQPQFHQASPVVQQRSESHSEPTPEEIQAFMNAEFEHEMSTWLEQQTAETDNTVVQDSNLTPTVNQAVADSFMPSSATEQLPVAQDQTDQTVQTEVISNTELARVAQQLVNSVADNTSEKFKNSSFMELIGRIAAGDVVVSNNEFVERPQAVSSEPSAAKPDIKGKGKAVANSTSVDNYDDST